MVNNYKLEYKKVSFIGYTWLFCSGFYLTSLTAISPIYLAFTLSFIVLTLRVLLRKEDKITYIIFLFFILSLFSLFLIINSPINLALNLTVSLLSPILIYIFFKDKKVNKKILLFFYLFYLMLFLIDASWRITHPNLEHLDQLDNLGIGYIIYKINSIMYLDSNFVGIQIVLFFSSFLYIFGKNKTLISNSLFIFFISTYFLSVILTFSRASILGCIISLYFYYFLRTSFRRKFLYFSCPFFIAYFIYLGSNFLNEDISFNSKFILIDLVINHLFSIDIYHLIFGVGLGNAHNYLGMGAHNLFFTILIETGIIGFIILIALITYFIFIFKSDFLFLILPFLIVSLSLSGTALSYFWGMIYFCNLIKNNRIIIN